jgi:hypothetical protein
VAHGQPSLLDIDFLPASYRQKCMQRRAYIWRVVAAAMILTFFTLAGLFQWNQQAQVRRELELVETQHADAMEMNAKFAEAAQELQTQQRSAELLTFLRHRWPRSQIIAAILDPMPESVRLSEWHIGHETIAATLTAQPPATPEAGAAPADKAARRAADLKRLLHESKTRQQFVLLSGEAGDAATLHEYLAKLGANPLFDHVDLRSLEHVLSPDKEMHDTIGRVQFTARAVVRSGHGPAPETKSNTPGETTTSPLAHQGGGS